jgi:hypothetical protein
MGELRPLGVWGVAELGRDIFDNTSIPRRFEEASVSLLKSRRAAASKISFHHLPPANLPGAPRLNGWAYTLPYRRFADVLAGACARIGGRRGLLLLHRSGLSPHTPCQSPGALGVAARTPALSPIRDTLIESFSHIVTSMTAPIASGLSDCRVGLAPAGKRRLC